MARATSPPRARLKEPLKVRGLQLSTAELVKRLKALHDELVPMEQEQVDQQSLESTAAELVERPLLVHKDKSVRAYTACCLADILKLYAPEPPYSDRELSDIFSFFFVQLRHLATPDDPQVHQYHYLLRNMAEVRSIALVCRLPDAEKLMNKVFEDVFDSLTVNTSRGIVSMAVDILSQLIDEMDSVPMDVVERILAQYLPKNAKARPYTLNVAKELCERSTDKLQRYVSQYFTEVLDSALDDLKDDDRDMGDEEDPQEDLARIKSAHGLIKEINRNCPGLLLNVVPQLEVELTNENEALRIMTTRTVGTMLAGNMDLANTYMSLWTTWLDRSADKSSGVRMACLENLQKVWLAHPSHSNDIQSVLAARFEDPDDKVRLSACSVFVDLDFELALHHLNASLLESLSMRIRDRKSAVASAAMQALSRFFSLAYASIERLEENVLEQFGWIPEKFAEAFLIPDQDLLCRLQAALLQNILPLPDSAEDIEAWVDRLMLVYSLIEDPKARKALLRQTNLSLKVNTWATFIDACEKYNGGVIDEDEEKVTHHLKALSRTISGFLPDSARSNDNLMKFAKVNEKRYYKLLRVMMNPDSDLKTILKAYHEFQRKMKDPRAESYVQNGSMHETMLIFMRRSGLLLLNQTALPALLRRVRAPGEGQNGENALQVARELLDFVAEGKPGMFAHHVDLLVEGLEDDTNSPYIDICLYALSLLAKMDSTQIDGSVSSGEKSLQDHVLHYVRHGTVSQTKAAATILALDSTSSAETSAVIAELVDQLASVDLERRVAHLNALSRFARYAPAAFEVYGENVTSYVLEQVLASPDDTESGADPDWSEDHELRQQAQACLAGLKLLTNRLRATRDFAENKAISKPIYSLLWQLLDTGGEVKGTQHIPGVASRFRSLAATSLLRLAAVNVHQIEVLGKFEALAWMIQDPVFQVRNKFLEKVTAYLFRQRLVNPVFNVILFLVAHDPEEENRNMAKANIVNRARVVDPERRIRLFEQPFLRMLHLISHHPDFTTEPEDILMTAKYINFYLDCVANADNISYLNFLANILKSVRDKRSTSSEHLYAISELADYLIKAWAAEKKWRISMYTGKVIVPQDLFAPLPSTDVARHVRSTHYLRREVLEALERDTKDIKARPKKPKFAKLKQAKSLEEEEARGKFDKAPEKVDVKLRKEGKTVDRPPARSKMRKSTVQRKTSVKKRKEWDSDASSAQDDEEIDFGDTSEEEVKPKGSRSRPSAKSIKKPPEDSNDDDEVGGLLVNGSQPTSAHRKRSSPATAPGRTSPKRRKRNESQRSD